RGDPKPVYTEMERPVERERSGRIVQPQRGIVEVPVETGSRLAAKLLEDPLVDGSVVVSGQRRVHVAGLEPQSVAARLVREEADGPVVPLGLGRWRASVVVALIGVEIDVGEEAIADRRVAARELRSGSGVDQRAAALVHLRGGVVEVAAIFHGVLQASVAALQ